MEYKRMQLLICCLYFLDQKFKDRLTYYLDNHLLDIALNRAMKEGNFLEWFKRDFSYDPLYTTLYDLRYLFGRALGAMLVEYAFSGGRDKVRITMTETTCRAIVKSLELNEENVKAWAKRLESFLLDAENEQNKFLAEQRGADAPVTSA